MVSFVGYNGPSFPLPRSPDPSRQDPPPLELPTLTTIAQPTSHHEYQRRIRAWTMYDWANSAFVTTILAAVLPIYYSQVAGATLPSPALATAYWSTGLSISLFIVALLSPVLGTISDVMRGKKRFLAVFIGIGVVSTGLLVFVQTGDWLLASILFVLGRIGFTAANVFYDAILPHVAQEEDRDRVSAQGFALGYLGGGLLLTLNLLMIRYIPGTWGERLSFLSVAVWWAVFSIPLFLRIPEPPAATAELTSGENVVTVSFKRLWSTLKDVRSYRELFISLLAILIYADGIGTIIGVAAIYGAELGFSSVELGLALLLVQFIAVPYSLIFGRLPDPEAKQRPFFLAFVIFNMLVLPLAGVVAKHLLPAGLNPWQVIVLIFAIQLLGLLLSWLFGKRLFSTYVNRLDTRNCILLALAVYTVIAAWGYFVSSVIEFWFIAWMVAVVQGGSQALSRSLFSKMVPASKSGEFFGLFSVMEKFSTIIGPLIFAFAVVWFGSSRPAVLSLTVFFIIGGWILSRVDVDAGIRLAQAEDAAIFEAKEASRGPWQI